MITIFEARNFFIGRFNSETQYTVTLSRIQNIVIWDITFKKAVVHFSDHVQKFRAIQSERKTELVQANMFQKGPFLTVHTIWLDSLMTSQYARCGQGKKNYAEAETDSSFRSECSNKLLLLFSYTKNRTTFVRKGKLI